MCARRVRVFCEFSPVCVLVTTCDEKNIQHTPPSLPPKFTQNTAINKYIDHPNIKCTAQFCVQIIVGIWGEGLSIK